jgi:PST family polysaccharide transporter
MAATVVVARLLTPHDFGVAATAAFFIQVAQRVTNLGFNTALIRVPELREDHSTTVFGVNVALGIGGGLLLAAAAPWLGDFYRSREASLAIPVAGLTFAIGSLGAVPAALMTRRLKFKQLVFIESVYGWVVSVTSVVLAWAGFGFWSLVYSLLVGAIWDATVKLLAARWWPALTISRAAFSELWSFGAGLHLKRLLDTAALNIDNMVIGRTLGLTVLGIYDKSFTSMNRAVTMVSYAGQTVSLSILARMQDDHERFRQAFRRITLGIGIASYPTFAALAAMAHPLFLLLFGPQWTGAVAPFQVLCAAGALKVYTSYVSSAVQAKGQVWAEVWRQLVYVLLIVVGVTLGSRWGLTGASAGVLLATAAMTGMMGDLVSKLAGLSWNDLFVPHLTGLTCAMVVAGAVVGARWILGHLDVHPAVWAEVLFEGTASVLCATGFLLVCPFAEGRRLVRETVFDFAPGVGRRLGLSVA